VGCATPPLNFKKETETLMKNLLLTFAALVLSTPAVLPAQTFNTQDAVGTWSFFVTINGAPPCQCIQIGRMNADGTIDAPGNDQFTGQGFGQWKKTGYRDISFTILQNAFNPDGTAGGLSVIKGTMSLNSTSDQATGSSTFQLIDNSGKVLASGTATFRATKLKLD
jgi:hypothetical protein